MLSGTIKEAVMKIQTGKLHSIVFPPWHYDLWADNPLLSGDALCFVGYFAASLASTQRMPALPLFEA